MAQNIQPVRSRRAQAATPQPELPEMVDPPSPDEQAEETGAKISVDTVTALDHALVEARQTLDDISEAFAGFCGFFNAVLRHQGHADQLGGHPLRFRIVIGTVETEVDLARFRDLLGEEAYGQYLANWLTYYHAGLREAAVKLAADAAKLPQILP